MLPRRWIMLDNAHAGSRCHRFLNTSTSECIRTDLPELAGHTLLALTPEGLLLLLHEPTLVIRLLNPLTCQLTDLPPVTGLLSPKDYRARHRGIELGKRLLLHVCMALASLLTGPKWQLASATPEFSPLLNLVMGAGLRSTTPTHSTPTHTCIQLCLSQAASTVSPPGVSW
ncbi:uncharacterized protein LOC111258011 [Setaria italica]|uniref:uncharacterized protein LOC111258011 n=1 Tax=Setaria italica TaxID=4555 RepID=UPI000350A1F5|nr:uncharacterized protein LOC111258011 [Setaria italica]